MYGVYLALADLPAEGCSDDKAGTGQPFGTRQGF